MPAQGSVEISPTFPGSRERFFVVAEARDLGLGEKKMKLTVNGEPHEHRGDGTIGALLDGLGAKKEHTALLLNGTVLPSKDWKTTTLNENDEIEMLVFVGGG